jgi:hypothetical protein
MPKETKETESKETESKDLVPFVSLYPSLDSDSIDSFKEAMVANFDEVDMTLRQLFYTVKVPSGGSTAWTMKNPDTDEEDMVKEITGIILDIGNEKALFEAPYGTAGANPVPLCVSTDGTTGVGKPGGECATCEFNQYGPGNSAKECNDSKPIYVLVRGRVFPIVIKATPGSFKSLKDYRIGLIQKGIKLFAVETVFGLKKSQNKSKIDYSEITFKAGARITDKATIEQITKYRSGIAEFMKSNTPVNVASQEENDMAEAS